MLDKETIKVLALPKEIYTPKNNSEKFIEEENSGIDEEQFFSVYAGKGNPVYVPITLNFMKSRN